MVLNLLAFVLQQLHVEQASSFQKLLGHISLSHVPVKYNKRNYMREEDIENNHPACL